MKLFFKSIPISKKRPEFIIMVENEKHESNLLIKNKPIKYVTFDTFTKKTVGVWRLTYKQHKN